jgi:hypothetical protein
MKILRVHPEVWLPELATGLGKSLLLVYVQFHPYPSLTRPHLQLQQLCEIADHPLHD